MDMKNERPSPHEASIHAAKWDAIGRIAAIAALPLIAFFALILKLAWHTLELTAPALLVFFEVVVVVVVVVSLIGFFLHKHKMGKLEAQRYEHNTYRTAPDQIGNYEAFFDQNAKTFIQAVPGNYQQPVYQTYAPHYAPSFQYQDSSHRLLPEPVEQDTTFQASIAPTIEEIVASLPRNGLQLSLGRSLTESNLLPFELPGNHIKIVGSSQKGKSSLAGGLLEQVQRTHDPSVLQFALLDLEYKTSRLFERSPHVAHIQAARRGRVPCVARNAQEVALWLKYLHTEQERRYRMSDQELEQSPYILMYFEEFLNFRRLLKGSPLLSEALNYFTLIAMQGLKAKISAMVCAQVDYSSDKLRDAMAQFNGVNVSLCLKPEAARSAGMISTDLLNQNYMSKARDQFVVESMDYTDIGIAPQYDVRAKVKALSMGASEVQELAPMPEIDALAPGAHPQRTLSAPETLHPPAPAWQAYFDQVLSLYKQGYRNQDVLIEKMFNLKKGGNQKWYEARDIVKQCLAAIPDEMK